ncbi:hypothetical protein A4R28_16495 [Mesorhizobium ciceri]|uniref:DUF5801 repeats-in-toxin domain-containing protein n=15 Tax=Mesorhizobium TaxID=68287 RepID=UPI0007A93758|nr:DUF5801 repeats-in-toxin domain-containing protein [Mesorhizobium ciceri]AMX94560.1 hypothetical protein A4R28_16495 [Mesorhizobium ciceri]
MALDILTQDIVLDETTGFTDDDINPAIPPYDTNPTVQYLLSLDDPGGLTSPEVAFQANFVVASASAGETITSVVLSQNLTGTPFSTTVGVNSGIQTVDGNYVWLFKDADPPHANVVIGVIGTSDPSAAPAATGPLAFSFGLVSTSATNADLYTVEYVPLLNPDATNPDDRIGLTNKVFASVTGTSVASFLGSAAAPGNNDFYLINSANDASKQLLVIGLNGGSANVSEQGFGINNQSINPNETLQVDFVTGGTLNAGSASQIQYGNHIETITQAGFTISQITPSTPTARVDVTVSAFNNTGNDQGTNFFDGTTTSPVDITGIKLTGTSGFASVITVDGTYATGSGNITVTGLSGTGNAVTITGLDNTTTVDITTGSPMDRLTVKGVDANEGCDISEFHFSATSTNAYSEEVGSHINFDDDGPSISTTGAEPTLTVDESVLTTNDTQSFAANFSSGFGADGAGTLTYALGVVAGPSGLIDTATGQAVILSLNGSVVEGHTIGSNDLVFTVSVSAAGAVTLDQLRAVVHADASNPDDSTSLAADNLVTLTATVTDKDGDHLSASLDIGQNLNFKDDGPSISTTGAEPTLTVDESVLTTNDTQSFAANFSSGFGADGAGTLTYALGVVAGPSGLIDTATGQAVILSLNGSVVEGHTIGSNDLVFTVSVSAAGAVTLDQLRAVVHADASNPDDSTSLAADNLVTLTATVTDKDGDHLSASLDIGQNLNFKDDGPSISTTGTEPTLTVDESVLTTNDTQSFAANFSSGFGADGAGTLTYALGVVAGPSGLIDTATGQAVILSLNGSVVEGHTIGSNDLVFTVSVSAAGAVTLDQLRAVVHADASNPDDSTSLAADNLVTLTATVTDKDGDHLSASLDIGQNLNFKDDGPSISTTGAEPTLTVDESVLTTNDTQSFAANFSSGFGADGAGTLTYALGVVAGPSGLIDTATGQAVILSLNGSVVEGHTIGSNDLVFTVSVSAAGAVTLDQLRAVVHADASNPDDSTSLAADNLVTLTATVTDKDGDHLSASLDIGQNLNFKDDGPSISTTGTEPTLTVDESVLTTNDTQSFAANFSSGFGADGAGTLTYALGVVAGPSGLIDTATGQAVVLSLNGSVVEGHTIGSNDLVFTVSVSAAGAVTLDQLRAVVHADASNPDDSTSLAADNLVTLTATVTDKDGDHLSASLDIGQNLNFKDDGPSISTTGTEPTLTVDESNLGANSADFATVFTPNAGADSDAISYALGINQVTNVSGLTDTLTGLSVLLFVEGGEVVGRAGSAAGDIVFTVSVAVDGTVTLDQARAVIHSPDTGPDQQTSLAADDLVTLTAIITDGDGDQASDSVNIGTSLVFKDDAPTITVPFDGDQNAGNGIGTPETLANTLNASATGAFGYDIGADAHPAAFYASGSDFVDQNGALAGVQIGLTGTITGGGGGNILTSEVTLASESLTSATFNFTFTYDKDPAAGTQTGTAGGTLVFDKIADTYTIHLTDPLEGFSFDVIHTSQLLSKEPLGNTGHPQIVLEKLQADDPNTPANENFYVQFTGNLINKANPFSLTANGEGSSGDATFTLGGHEMVSNANESWVSATQSTNGVAGDTIQKGELLTLRFFDSNVGINSQNEATQPTATAGTMAIKFDGIGNSEDLMLILNLIDDKGTASTLDDVSITRAMYVQNADIFKMGHVPAPYSGEFTLDNNDGLVIIEQNDYNAAGEHFVLQGVQIMQSGNGITGNNTAINLNPTTGAGGGSDATTNLVNFDPTDNDVLKITDIGFTSTSTQTPDAHLDFAFKVADADADQTAMQHILVDVA